MSRETFADWIATYDHRPDECSLWPKATNVGSYGLVRKNGKAYRANRYSWIVHHGPIPSGLLVCHRCDNPPCCNPHHLFLGTHLDNARDKIAKGRSPGHTRSIIKARQCRSPHDPAKGSRHTAITVTLPVALAHRIAEEAQRRGMTSAAWLRQVVEDELDRLGVV